MRMMENGLIDEILFNSWDKSVEEYSAVKWEIIALIFSAFGLETFELEMVYP